jgi:hypothetical protein
MVDDRFPLLEDLIEVMSVDAQASRADLDMLLTHPAIKTYEQMLAVACAASDLITDRATTSRLGRSLLIALDHVSGDRFVGWEEEFPPEVEAIDGDFRDFDQGQLLWHLLDRHDGLQYVIRVLRNRSSHRIPDIAREIGEIPFGFTQSWVRFLPHLFTLLWSVVSQRQFRSYFHDYLHDT